MAWAIGASQPDDWAIGASMPTAAAPAAGVARPKINATLASGMTSIGRLIGAILIVLLLGI